MPNRLIHETSPYLLQHAHNPVDWYPWGEEALEKARREDKPIFLSIGYAACHWCHVMAHESFEDEETAAIMNEHFVNIKVDREERPDLDQIYMQAVVAMTGQGGWPMKVFLTPDGRPFYGGTYFPPVRRFGMPSFKEVLLGIAHAWAQDRENVEQVGGQLQKHLQQGLSFPVEDQPLQPGVLSEAVRSLRERYDTQNGGWGDAPKFPQAMAIEFLLRQATRGNQDALPMAEHALQAMARGGMYDVVGGGFHRYSVDMRWRVPHFEKMLYDNALLARSYLYAYLLTGQPAYRRICERTLDFIVREMTHPDGGFYASLDADSEGQEGRFYVWTLDELHAALGDPADVALFTTAYGVSEEGNFENGNNVLQRTLSDDQLAARFGMPVEEVATRLQVLNARLLDVRSARVRPATDDKVLTAWNALALRAFAEAARYLGREDYCEVATRNAAFLLQHLFPSGQLFRTWRDGRHTQPAFLEDHAALAVALLELYQMDANPRWYTAAEALIQTMIERFSAPDGGFFDTAHDHEALITRPRELQDNATPSGNALAAHALLMLVAYTGRGDLYDRAEASLRRMQTTAARYPTAFSYWLCAMDFALGPVHEVAILGDPTAEATQALLREVWRTYRPRLVLAVSPAPGDAPPLLQGRDLVNGKSTAYVCQRMVCRQPVTEPEALRRTLTNEPTNQ